MIHGLVLSNRERHLVKSKSSANWMELNAVAVQQTKCRGLLLTGERDYVIHRVGAMLQLEPPVGMVLFGKRQSPALPVSPPDGFCLKLMDHTTGELACLFITFITNIRG